MCVCSARDAGLPKVVGCSSPIPTVAFGALAFRAAPATGEKANTRAAPARVSRTDVMRALRRIGWAPLQGTGTHDRLEVVAEATGSAPENALPVCSAWQTQGLRRGTEISDSGREKRLDGAGALTALVDRPY